MSLRVRKYSLRSMSSRKGMKEEKVNVSIFDGSGVGTSGSLHKKVQFQKNGFRDVLTLVCKSIEEIDDKKGSSLLAIRNWMKVHYDTVNETRLKTGLKKAIEKGLATGVLISLKSAAESHGMSGRFKVDKIKLAETKKKGKPKKPARSEEEPPPIAQKSKPKDEDNSKGKKIGAKKELATKKPLPKKIVKELTEKLSEMDLNKDSISSRGKSKKPTVKKPAQNEEQPIAQKSKSKKTKPKDNKCKPEDEDNSKGKKIAAKKELATKKPLPKITKKELTEKLREIDLNKDSISSRVRSKKPTAKSAEQETNESKENKTGRVKQTKRNAK